MTKFQQDLADAITLMIELDKRPTLSNRGSWSEWAEMRGYLIQAGVDCGSPVLNIYTNTEIVKAYRLAKRELEQGIYDTIEESFADNWPC